MTEEVEVIEGEVVPEDETPEALALAIREEQAVAIQPGTYLPTPKEFEAMTAIALRLSSTEFVPSSYRGKPDTVLAAILSGRELGIGPMQSLRDIHMIDGRPAFAAHLMLAKLRAGGVSIIDSESTNERAMIHARRTDTGEEATVSFTMEDAKAAKLADKKNWQTYRSDMLWARAVSRLARRLGSDLMGGLVYSKEEVEDFEGDYGVSGSGYEAMPEREFDPGRDLLPNAIQGASKEAVERVESVLNNLSDIMDWKATIGTASLDHFGHARDKMTKAEKDEWWVRLRNAVAKLEEIAHPELGASPEQIQHAFGFAFGIEPEKVALVQLPVEEEDNPNVDVEMSEADQAIPFGD